MLASGDAVLTHSMGRRDPSETVLTQAEFCRRLTVLRREAGREKPCRYCTGGARTGLPDNACENCMNTRVEH